ncbi:unnamed protein product [Arctia plantaginis]|uniref:Uncharacterized protein n=1 Tax=Arctia plantaginis TaxID=874455 RepID=A0A8S0YR75_ARCPL|nr:unnamed protein product [Arctia plantaginis]
MGQTKSTLLDTLEDLWPCLPAHSTLMDIPTTIDEGYLQTGRRKENMKLFDSFSFDISSVRIFCSSEDTKDSSKDWSIAGYVEAYENKAKGSSGSLGLVQEGCKNRSVCKRSRKTTKLFVVKKYKKVRYRY